MSQQTSAKRQNKYAWLDVDRAELPTRSATERVADFLEVFGSLDEATAREQASRCIQCPEPTCAQHCPLSNRIPEWLSLTAEGHFLEAAAISRSTSNLPEICGRVCPQERLCEGSCILNGRSEPVSIGAIERFINEYAIEHGVAEALGAPPNGYKVAVIGSGPAGLTCADELSRWGYSVSIYESQSLPGGLLVNGIPAFKLDKTIVERRVRLLEKRGVKFFLGTRIGEDIPLSKLCLDHDAVFIGIGAYQAKALRVPGGDLKNVYQGLLFLVQKNVNVPLDLPDIDVKGKRVVVLGGGDTAMDCLRTAVRCEASEVTCLYRRDFENMPGSRKEYKLTVEEGASFQFLTNPIALEADRSGKVKSVRCIRMQLGAPDASGRRRPEPVPDSEFEFPADVVLIAYGFDPVRFPKDSDFGRIEVNEWGGMIVDENQMTSVQGVYAGGDLVRGPSLVVHAVRDARRAAQGIDRALARADKGQAPTACRSA